MHRALTETVVDMDTLVASGVPVKKENLATQMIQTLLYIASSSHAAISITSSIGEAPSSLPWQPPFFWGGGQRVNPSHDAGWSTASLTVL